MSMRMKLMAEYTANLIIETTNLIGVDSARHPIHDTGVDHPDVIEAGSIHRTLIAGTGIGNWYARNQAGDLSGYKLLASQQPAIGFGTLLSATCDPGAGSCETLIERFATTASDMAGIRSVTGTTTFEFRGNYGDPAPWAPPGAAELRCRVYHRDAGGLLTLLASFGQVITQQPTTYTREVTLTRSWQNGERLIVEWYAYFEAPPV